MTTSPLFVWGHKKKHGTKKGIFSPKRRAPPQALEILKASNLGVANSEEFRASLMR